MSYGVKVSERLGVGTSLRYIHSKLTSGLREGTGEGNAATLATDISALYRSAPFALGGADATFSAGLNIANLGGTLDFNENSPDEDPIPANLRFGPALTIDFDEYNSLTFATDFNKSLVSTERKVVDGDTARVGKTGFEALFDSWGSARGQVGPDGEASSLSLVEQFTVGTGVEYWYSDLFALRTGYYYENPRQRGPPVPYVRGRAPVQHRRRGHLLPLHRGGRKSPGQHPPVLAPVQLPVEPAEAAREGGAGGCAPLYKAGA